MNLIFESRHKASMGIYLRILALIYLYGGIGHYANLIGFGEIPFIQEPLSWQIMDIYYAILATFTVIGLWLKTRWGIICFFLSAASQLILYIGFPQCFAFTVLATIFTLVIDLCRFILIYQKTRTIS